MKKLLFIVCLFSMTAHAEEIKLQCQMHYTKTFLGNSSQPKTIQETVILIIKDEGKNKTDIQVEGKAEMMGVSSPQSNQGGSNKSIDMSDANQWKILQQDFPDASINGKTTIYINRNSGVISYEDRFTSTNNGSTITGQITRGSGTCSKVDTTKRKF